MTPIDRFERQLPAALIDLADERTPDYFIDLLGRTARSRQRPAWSFPGRWFPMADIASRPAFMPRLPWRTIGVALVILALLVAGVVVVVGSQTKLPPPFGLARNGLVAYSTNGDIYTLDPVTESPRAIVTGPDVDRTPFFSPDGTRIAFFRQVDAGSRFDIVVVAADGSGLKVITTEPTSLDYSINWAPDSQSLIIDKSGGDLLRLDATKAGPPEVITHTDVQGFGAFEPPNGDRILYRGTGPEGTGLWVINADGSDAHALIAKDAAIANDNDFAQFQWSPDGTMIAFTQAPRDGPGEVRVFVMKADGTDVRPVDNEPGRWTEVDFVWAPDSRHVAFNRWRQDPTTQAWLIQPIGVASLDGSPILDAGPAPASEGAVFDYSPDGSTFLSLAALVNAGDPAGPTDPPVAIDTADGTSHDLAWAVGSRLSWQRLAP